MKIKEVDLKIYQNKVNKQQTIVLPRKIFGLVREAKYDIKNKTVTVK